ncbi:hypothetical protein BC332_10225 [Capsicum chinense]|nr:hypothetical protein BC332_10225 [Capsicum chinense]
MKNNWFKKGFNQIDKPPILDQEQDKSPCSIFDIVDDSDAESSSGHKEQIPSTMKLTFLNAFDIISLSPAFDLSNLFEKDKNCRSDARFTTQNSTSNIVSRLEEVASMGSFKVSLAIADTRIMAALAFDDIIQSDYVKNQALVAWRAWDHT